MIIERDCSIPNTWGKVTIDKILDFLENGNTIQQGWSPRCETIPSADETSWGVLKTTAIQIGSFLPEHNKKLPKSLSPRPNIEVKKGDILMTCAGPRLRCGVTCLVKQTRKKLLMSGKMYRFRTNPDKISSKYLEAFLQSQEALVAIDKMKTGISDSGLNLTHDRFKTLLVPIAPTNEQHRIVAKIEELFSEIDKGVESLKTAKARLQVYRQALLKHAFEGKLTAQWRSDNPDKVLPAAELLRSIEQARKERYQQQLTDWQTAVEKWEFNGKEGKKPSKPRKIDEYSAITDEEQFNLIDLPKGWVWIRLGEVTWSVKDGPHYSPKYSNHGIPFITGGNVRPHGVDFENVKYITSELHEELSQRCKPEFGDILYTKGGTTGIARVNTYTHNFNVWVHVAVLKIVHSVKPFFLQHALNSPFCYSQSQKYTHGVGNQDLGLTRMVNIFLAICSEDEQAEVINIVESKMSVMLEIEAEIDRSLKKAEMLRQSILKKAFSGQLVPQDPTDEPASELLKRIQAEKAQRETTTKTKLKSTNLPRQLTVLRDI